VVRRGRGEERVVGVGEGGVEVVEGIHGAARGKCVMGVGMMAKWEFNGMQVKGFGFGDEQNLFGFQRVNGLLSYCLVARSGSSVPAWFSRSTACVHRGSCGGVRRKIGVGARRCVGGGVTPTTRRRNG
jgi:hypothetical protein